MKSEESFSHFPSRQQSCTALSSFRRAALERSSCDLAVVMRGLVRGRVQRSDCKCASAASR